MNTPSTTAASLPGRADYPQFLAIPTRWMDNDVYGHVNNVVYYSYFDTVINEHLIREGGLDIHEGAVVGYCVESQCRYLAPLAFPETIEAGLLLTELIARDEDDYIAKAAALATDAPRLAAIRASLRSRVLTSPLCDGPGFAGRMEAVLRGAWQSWCGVNPQ